jgi:hypothetical protein
VCCEVFNESLDEGLNIETSLLKAIQSCHCVDSCAVCQSVEPECKDGLTVTCKTGNYIGCDCNYIRQCRPEVLNCVRSNKTHTVSCGF